MTTHAAHRTGAVPAERIGEAPSVPTLTELLARRAHDAGGQEFLRFGEWSWSFAEIDAWTSRLAHRMVELDDPDRAEDPYVRDPGCAAQRLQPA